MHALVNAKQPGIECKSLYSSLIVNKSLRTPCILHPLTWVWLPSGWQAEGAWELVEEVCLEMWHV